MVKVLVDTSIFIEEIRCGSKVYGELIGLYDDRKIDLYVSVIVIAELWAGKSMNTKSKRLVVEKLLKPFRRIEVGESISKKSGDIMRSGQCKGMDALIAACCIEKKAKLATLNVKDFEKVEGLKIWKLDD